MGTDTFEPSSFGFEGSVTDAHMLTFRATLTTNATPRVLIDTSVDRSTSCTNRVS